MKYTFFFTINKYKCLHTCVNPCLNRDHQQLDSNLAVDHIKIMIKAQFTLSITAIQTTIMEKFGYEIISYKKKLVGKHKALTTLFRDFHKSYVELSRFFMALEHANSGCVVTWKKFDSQMHNTEVFQCVFWAFHPSIEGFNYCQPILSNDGTHLYENYKCTLMIVMGCDGNNKFFLLAFAITEGENISSWGWFLACIRNKITQRMRLCVISNRHPDIMTTMIDVHLGWTEPYAYHTICMRHLTSNFMNQFKDKILKNLVCRAALATKVGKFNIHMDTIGRINLEAQDDYRQPLLRNGLFHMMEVEDMG